MIALPWWSPRRCEWARFGSIRCAIAANKICTLLGRAEAKDLLDLRAMMEGGVQLREAMADAETKEAGVNAAMLAFLMGDEATWAISPGPAGTAAELKAFREKLAKEFRAIAFEQAR